MLLHNDFVVKINVEPVYQNQDLDKVTEDKIKKFYEGKCYMNQYIIQVEKIKHRSSCTFTLDSMDGIATISVEFTALVCVYEPDEIIPLVDILETDEKRILGRFEYGIVNIMYREQDKIHYYKQHKKMPVKVIKVIYNIFDKMTISSCSLAEAVYAPVMFQFSSFTYDKNKSEMIQNLIKDVHELEDQHAKAKSNSTLQFFRKHLKINDLKETKESTDLTTIDYSKLEQIKYCSQSAELKNSKYISTQKPSSKLNVKLAEPQDILIIYLKRYKSILQTCLMFVQKYPTESDYSHLKQVLENAV